MNDSQNWNVVGEQIKGALSDALRTGDFTDLNELVSQTVTDTLNDAGKHIAESFSSQTEKKKIDSGQKPPEKEQQNPYYKRKEQLEEERRIRRQQQEEDRARRRQHQQELKQKLRAKQSSSVARPKTTALVPARFRQVGNVSNVLYQVFGGIGLGLSSLVAFFRLFAAFGGDTTAAGWIVNLLFIAAFFGMIRHGVNQRNRLSRARRYIQLCGSRMYGQIESLARDTGKSVRFVAKDIHKMLSLGMFPEGHLDEKKTCFMLNDSVHRQYLEAEKARMMREQQQIRENETAIKKQPVSSTGTDGQAGKMGGEQEAELNTMIAEGMECIRKLRELNDQIPGEVISEKLYRLENLLKDIFDSVREHPEQMHRMHKLMDYYLPTTLKLVEAYEDFDKISSPGPDIVSAKAEIERTMDIINQAFAELLGSLFQDAVMDATTDAQVLQTMLAKEGLTRNAEFAKP